MVQQSIAGVKSGYPACDWCGRTHNGQTLWLAVKRVPVSVPRERGRGPGVCRGDQTPDRKPRCQTH